MPRRRNWKRSRGMCGNSNSKKKPTDLTEDTGLEISDPTNSNKVDYDCQQELVGDTVLQTDINNSDFFEPKERENTFLKAPQNISLGNYATLAKNTPNSENTCGIYSSNFLRFGNFDQSSNMFAAETRGNQCTCICLVFLALNKLKHTKCIDLNYILQTGDAIYSTTIQQLRIDGKFRNMLLTLDETPMTFDVGQMRFTVEKKDVVFGAAIQSDKSDTFLSLQEGLLQSFGQSKSLLVMIGAICSAVLFDGQNYFFFDSHSHSKSGLFQPLDNSGVSILIAFSNIYDLVNYMYAYYTSMHIDLMNQYEIMPVAFTVIDKSSHLQDQMQRYFEDQLTKQSMIMSESGGKKSFMKLYMQKRRKNLSLYQKELEAKRLARKNQYLRKKELEDKREKRQDQYFRKKESEQKRIRRKEKDYSVKELEDKREKRKDKEYRVKELKKMREIRKDKEYTDKELKKKREQRKDKEYRDKELKKMREIRKDKEYTDKELKKKREQRKDKEYTDKELEKKREIRKDKEYRDKELEKKREIRKDKEYTDKELEKKREIRKDKEYRDKELEKKREIRKDKEYTDKELEKKREIRKDKEYRDKELEKKREQRKDKEYRDKELEKKREKRQDKDFRNAELQLKRAVREEAFFKEKERILKQTSRDKSSIQHKNYDKKYKQDKRKDPLVVVHESELRRKKQFGSTIMDCIKVFETKVSEGPIYVCTCCHQTWFRESVIDSKSLHGTLSENLEHCLTGYKSVHDKEWICYTCKNALKKSKVPRLSIANKMGFPVKPKELELFPLEERLISLRIPFMQIHELPRGGQLCVKGNVVNVPVDIQPTIQSLPRRMDQAGTVPVKLKKRLAYKKCDFSENVRPLAVLCALHYLVKNSDLYSSSGIEVDENWQVESAENTQEDENTIDPENATEDSDHFSEIDDSEVHSGNNDTLLDHMEDPTDQRNDTEYTFAPGEGQKPVGLYNDPDAEYLSFPTIFCGLRRPINAERSVPVHYTDIVKWELRSIDRRVPNSVPNIFFKLKKIQMKNISDKVSLAVRRCKTEGKIWTASDILNPSTVDSMVRLDEGYFIFRSLRNSPAYLEKRKKDLLALIMQLGLPTWFSSLSSADTRWKDLLGMLAKLDGKNYSDEEIDNLDWKEKTRLIQKDPVTCSRYFDYRVQQFIKIVLKSNLEPIGKVTDFFYRVEFQQRGSPHIHMMTWIENSPKYGVDTNLAIIEFVDRYCSCEMLEDIKDLIALQVHKHSKTCRKKGAPVCRFGFPLPPFEETVILEPLEEDVGKYKAIYKEIQRKINDMHDIDDVDLMTYHEFLDEYLGISEEDYVKAVRSSLNGPKVFLKRKPCEVRINPYMKNVLKAWKANHDIQFILDAYACASYILSYITKSQKGMSALLDQATKEARQGNLDIRRQVRHIGNYFLNSVETSAQEAIYLALQMPLSRATRQVVFINTSLPEKRTVLLKRTTDLEKLSPESTDIEAGNNLKRYSKRPNALQNWCLADFISQLDIAFAKIDMDDHSESEDDGEVVEYLDNENKSPTKKVNIQLKNGMTIKERSVARVIRYVKFSKKTDQENYFRERMLLFMPWRDELKDLKGECESYEDKYRTVENFVEAKAKKYEHNAGALEDALQVAENDARQFDELAPGTQQVEGEDEEEGTVESSAYMHFNPTRPVEHRQYDMAQDLGISHSTNVDVTVTEQRMKDVDYHELLRSLNKKQREFFDHVIHWMKTRHNKPFHLFLTGGAGVGKSIVIRCLYQALHRLLCSKEGEDPEEIRIILCAPTGKAAFNINGSTIHHAFGIQPNKSLNQSLSCDVLNTFRMKYRHLSVVIIDEISMVGKRMFSLLNTRLQMIIGNDQPFGGVSVLAVGDLLQLKPVCDDWIFNDLHKDLTALAPNVWKELFLSHELTDIMRQKDDLKFAKLLNRLRENKMNEHDIATLESRLIDRTDSNLRSLTHLFFKKDDVWTYNSNCIAKLTSEKVVVKAFDDVKLDISNEIKSRMLKKLPDDTSKTGGLASKIELAVGMKYDLNVNVNVDDGLTNGASGQIEVIDYRLPSQRPSIIWVKFFHSKIGKLSRRKYSHLFRSDIDRSLTPIFDVKRSFLYNSKPYERIQFPLTPAAAKTIHKAQGDTVEEIVVDLQYNNRINQPHLHYVALSRVTSLNGLHVIDLNKENIRLADEVLVEYERLRTQAALQLCYTPLYHIDDKFFKMVFLNSRSLHCHFDDCKSDRNFSSADIIGIAETRLISSDLSENYCLPGFHLPIRCDDKQKTLQTRPPHGLALYVKSDSLIELVFKYSTLFVEFMIVDVICHGKGHMQVVVLYKAPNCKLHDFKDVLTHQLKPKLDPEGSNVCVMGDFNLNSGPNENSKVIDFIENLIGCKQVISAVTTDYSSMLDLIFLQTEHETYAVVSYQLDKRDSMSNYCNQRTPVKLSNFRWKTNIYDSSKFDIQLSNQSSIQVVKKLDFSRKEDVPEAGPSTSCKSGVTSIKEIDVKTSNMMYNVAGKIVSKYGERFTCDLYGQKKDKQQFRLADTTGSTIITVWEDQINLVEVGKTYQITNISSRIFMGEFSLTTTKATNFEEDHPLEDDILSHDLKIPDLEEVKGRIISVGVTCKYHCPACDAVASIDPNATKFKCGACNLKSKKELFKTAITSRFNLRDQQNKDHRLVAFTTPLEAYLESIDSKHLITTPDLLEDYLLDLEELHVSKTKDSDIIVKFM
ncbi:hypothetical protein ScPMuIL_015642 [Solemya velum]